MRELRDGTYTLAGVTSMGGPATVTLAAGEQLSEALYKAVPQADRKRFKRVRATESPAPSPAAETD